MNKPHVFYPSVGFLLISGIVFSVAGLHSSVFAQKTSSTTERLVMPTVSRSATGTAGRFIRAAAENGRLRNNLRWDFSGKVQTGWNIYLPLISQTIGSDSGPETPEFADAVAKWQSKAGIEASGVVDADTVKEFISYWQSRRLFKFGYPAADQLMMAPIEDFYDPTREPELCQLDSQTYAAYKRMVAAATKETGLKLFTYADGTRDPRFLRIVSGFRSQEYQDSLRKKQPSVGRGALAKLSAHSTGRAIDVYVGGEPVITKDFNRLIQVQTPAYKWLVKNAGRFGFVPYFFEPWHWEYVGSIK